MVCIIICLWTQQFVMIKMEIPSRLPLQNFASALRSMASLFKIERILLILQHGDGYWLPWWRIELGESIEAALVREVKEETGYDIEMGWILDCQSSFFRTNTSKRHIQSILIFHSANIVWWKLSDTWFEEGEKAWMSQAEWIDVGKISWLKFYRSTNIEQIIRKYTFFHN